MSHQHRKRGTMYAGGLVQTEWAGAAHLALPVLTIAAGMVLAIGTGLERRGSERSVLDQAGAIATWPNISDPNGHAH